MQPFLQSKMILLLGASAALLSGCWVKKTTCRGMHNQMPGTCSEFTENNEPVSSPSDGLTGAISSGAQPDQTDSYIVPVAPTITNTQSTATPGFSLSRVTPEQLSNNVVSAVNFGAEPNELRWNDEYSGQTHDYLQLLFGVPLGGIDFETSSVRDPSSKAQTLLVSRVIAMLLAQASLGKEWDKGAGNQIVFNKCDFNADRPFRDSDLAASASVQTSIRAGEVRWNDQVDELFFRFYARPPNAAELSAVKTAFLAGMDTEGYPFAGWVPVVYALLASQEFWHQ